jgi:hypothetical protein
MNQFSVIIPQQDGGLQHIDGLEYITTVLAPNLNKSYSNVNALSTQISSMKERLEKMSKDEPQYNETQSNITRLEIEYDNENAIYKKWWDLHQNLLGGIMGSLGVLNIQELASKFNENVLE